MEDKGGLRIAAELFFLNPLAPELNGRQLVVPGFTGTNT